MLRQHRPKWDVACALSGNAPFGCVLIAGCRSPLNGYLSACTIFAVVVIRHCAHLYAYSVYMQVCMYVIMCVRFWWQLAKMHIHEITRILPRLSVYFCVVYLSRHSPSPLRFSATSGQLLRFDKCA